VGGDLVTTLGIVTAKTVEELIVGVDLGVVLRCLAFMVVGSLDDVVILINSEVIYQGSKPSIA